MQVQTYDKTAKKWRKKKATADEEKYLAALRGVKLTQEQMRKRARAMKALKEYDPKASLKNTSRGYLDSLGSSVDYSKLSEEDKKKHRKNAPKSKFTRRSEIRERIEKNKRNKSTKKRIIKSFQDAGWL